MPLHDQDSSATLKLFVEAAQEYLNTLDAKLSTHMVYENMLNNYWVPHFGRRIAQEISERDINEHLAGLNLTGKTKRNILIPLRGALDHAGVRPNPAAYIKPKLDQKAPLERYKPQERDKLIKTLEGQAQAYFALLFGAGLRPSEAWALTWDCWDGAYLSVHQIVDRGRTVRKGTKTNQSRRVYVPEWVRPYINNLPTRFKGDHIFQNSLGGFFKSGKTLNLAWRKAHKKLRIPCRNPYACRHTRAAELLSTGVEPARAAKQLGHSVEMFLRIYAEFIEEFCNRDDSELEGYKKPVTVKTQSKVFEDGL